MKNGAAATAARAELFDAIVRAGGKPWGYKKPATTSRVEPRLIACAQCGAEVLVPGVSHNKLYCTDDCARRSRHARRRTGGSPCLICGHPSPREANKYCSRDCAATRTWPPARFVRNGRERSGDQSHKYAHPSCIVRYSDCKTCGEVFISRKDNHVYCSSECRALMSYTAKITGLRHGDIPADLLEMAKAYRAIREATNSG